MKKILIISSSIRTGRKSNRVGYYFRNYLLREKIAEPIMADLAEYNFPLFEERLKYTPDPPQNLLDWASAVKNADGIILITPEYNGGYPASLKNAIDVLYEEWEHKPVAIVTVSSGNFGGTQVITSLQFTLFKMKARTVTAMYPVPNIEKAFDENGKAQNQEATDKRTEVFIRELMWTINTQDLAVKD
ncbi:MAG: NADPH-dependent FMN reductase [Ferruginibacter sp.]